MIINPFFQISSTKNKDEVFGRKDFLKKIKNTIIKEVDNKSIILINGEFGIGKSFFINQIVKELNKRKSIKIFDFDFSLKIIDELRGLPSESKLKKQIVVIIDKFELIIHLNNMLKNKIINLMKELTELRITFVVSSSNNLMNELNKFNPELKKYFKILNVPKLGYEEAKRLIISRLNSGRSNKSDSLEPFTVKEIKEIYKNSRGNPRIILMLCGALFEEKF